MSTRLVGWALRDVPEAHPDLSTGARLLLVYLADHFNEDEGAAWPSQGRLAHRMGTTERTVRRWLDELTALNLVVVESNKKYGKANVYRMGRSDTTSYPGRTPRPVRSDKVSGEVGRGVLLTNKEPVKEKAAPPEVVASSIAEIRKALGRSA